MSGVTYKITGRGEKGGPAKKMLIFTATMKVDGQEPTDPKKEDLAVFVEGPEEVSKVSVMGGEKGAYVVGFTPNEAGQYWVDFQFKGVFAADPFLLPIKDMFNKCPEHPYEGKLKKAAGGSTSAPAPAPAKSAAVDTKKKEEEEEKKRKEEEDRKKKEAEEQKRKKEEADKKAEADRKLKEEEDRKRKEEEDRKHKEEDDKRKKEEEDRKKKEEADRKKKEDEDRKKKEEEDLKKKEEADRKADADRKVKEEDRKKKEEADRKKKEDDDRKKKEDDDRKKKEDDDRKKKEEEDRKKKEEADRKKKEDDDRKKKEEGDRKKKEEDDRTKKESEDKKRRDEEDDRRKRREEEEQRKEQERERLEKEREEKRRKAQERLASKKASQSDVSASAELSKVTIKFRALNKNEDAKTSGKDASAFKATGNGQAIQNIEHVGNGLYSFEYICKPGANVIDVQLNGKPIKGFPLKFNKKTESERAAEYKAREEEETAEEHKEEEKEIKKEPAKKPQDKPKEKPQEKEPPKKATEEPAAPVDDDTAAKLKELEERKRKVAEKRAEIAAKRVQSEAIQPSAEPDLTRVPSARAALWEAKLAGKEEEAPASVPKPKVELLPEGTGASKVALWKEKLEAPLKEEEKPKPPASPRRTGNIAEKFLKEALKKEEPAQEEKKIELPEGTGASKVASLWQNRLQGKEPLEDKEPKEEKKIELPEGTGASKVASVWKNRLEGKEPEPAKIEKTQVDLPAGTGASKLTSVFENIGKDDKPKPLEKVTKRDPNEVIGKKWEQQAASAESSTSSSAKKDLDDLKAMMAKERAQMLGPGAGGGGGGSLADGVFLGDSDELAILAHFINEQLAEETNIPHQMPLEPTDATKVFEDLADGIIACYFFDKMIPEVMDVRVITRKVKDTRDKVDNWNLCVNSCKGSGCRLPDVKVDDLAAADPEQIMKVIWQIVKVGLDTEIKLNSEYLEKIFPDKSIEDIEAMPLEKLLLGWVNAICKDKSKGRVAKSIANDFKDSFFYLILFDEILATGLDLLDEPDDTVKAETVVATSEELARGPVITALGIVEGVYWMNFIFLASILLTASIL